MVNVSHLNFSCQNFSSFFCSRQNLIGTFRKNSLMWHCYIGFEQGNQFGVSEFWGGHWIFVCMYVLVWGTESAIFDTKILCRGNFGVGTRTHDVDNSLRILSCAIKPSTLKRLFWNPRGRVRTQRAHLPRIPRVHIASHIANRMDSQNTCYLQITCVPTWSNLSNCKQVWGGISSPFLLCG